VATGTASAPAVATPLRYRRNVARLTAGQLDALRRATAAAQRLSDDRGYRYYAGIHGLPLPIGCDNAHGTPYFLSWHRAYLYFFERALRDRVPQAMLAWWDWRVGPRRPARIPDPYTEAQAGGQANPLHDAEIDPLALQQAGRPAPARTRRRPGAAGAPPLPSAQEVEDALTIRDFVGFSAEIEACTTACTCGSAATWARSRSPPSTPSSGATTA
jgi:tyrosinase